MAITLNPDNVLKRGYARVEKRGGGTVMSAKDARAAGALSLRFADGTVDARVERSSGQGVAAVKATQGDLF